MATRKASKGTKKMSRRAGGAGSARDGRSRNGGALMTVQEAGRLGGLIGGRKGGLTVKRERGVEFYQEIGKLGGQRIRELIAAGKKELNRNKQRARGARR